MSSRARTGPGGASAGPAVACLAQVAAGQRRFAVPWITLGLVALAGLAFVALPSPLAIAYRPAAPSLPRLLGCHLGHFSLPHFGWDALTFGALGCYSELRQRARYVAYLLLAAIGVPPLACALEPWVVHYAGLSGLVIGQLALALGARLRHALQQRARWSTLGAGLLLLLLFLKQLYEYRIGDTSLITLRYEGFATVPAAHLISAAAGALVGGLWPSARAVAVSPASTTARSAQPAPARRSRSRRASVQTTA